jgi:hypothetical protein
LEVWIGHYMENPKEWFVVWAKNKREAFLQIDATVWEPDMKSLKELHAPGFVDFAVVLEEEKKFENMRFLPPKDYVARGYWLVLGGALGKNVEAEEYVLKTPSKPKNR